MRERIADQVAGFRRRISREQHAGGIHLEDVVGFFFGKKSADAGYALGAGGLNLLPEGVQFFGFGVELRFVELGQMESVGF